MSRLKSKLIIIFIALISLFSTYSLVITADQKKKLEKFQTMQKQYATQYAGLTAYQHDYKAQQQAVIQIQRQPKQLRL